MLHFLLVLIVVLIPSTVRSQLCRNGMLVLDEDRAGYLAAPDRPSLRVHGALTVELWMRTESFVERAALIEKSNGQDRVNYSLSLGTNGTITARVLTPTGAVTVNSASIGSVDAWHHVAMVFVPGDSLYLYIDGRRSAAVRVTAALLVSGSDSLRIGTSVQSDKRYVGELDEIRVWRSARTPAEIEASRRTVLTGPVKPDVLYYTFDDDPASSKVYDFSGNGNTGFRKQYTVVLPTTAPVTGVSTAFKLDAKEESVAIPLMLCQTEFDTVIWVRNLGLDTIAVNFVGLQTGSAFSVAGPQTVTLPPDSNIYGAVRIQFDPTAPGTFTDTLIVSSSAYCAGELRIGLSGRRDIASLSVRPAVLNFVGTLNCELPQTTNVTLRNTGNVRLNIAEIVQSQDIGITIVSPSTPFSIDAGQSRVVAVRVAPGTEVEQVSSITFKAEECDASASLEVRALRIAVAPTLPPNIEFPPLTLNSSGVAADTVVTFINTSTRKILVREVLLPVNSQFTIADQILNVEVLPGDTLLIPVQFSATGCGKYVAQLRVFSDPCDLLTTSRLAVDVFAPRVTSVGPADAGFNCGPGALTLELKNDNDVDVRISGMRFNTPGVFTLPSGFTFPATIAPDSVLRVPLLFSPLTDGEYSVVLSLLQSTCDPMQLTLTGARGTGSVTFSDNELDLGRGCDLATRASETELLNNSPRPLTIERLDISGSPRFSSSLAFPITIPAGGSQPIEISYAPVMGQRDQAEFTLITSSGCEIRPLNAYGSRERPAVTASVAMVNFDTVCPTTSRELTLQLTHHGIDSVDLGQVALSLGSHFSIEEGPLVLHPGQAANTRLRFTPAGLARYDDTLLVDLGSCAATLRIPLAGFGGSQPKLSSASSSLAFGGVPIAEEKALCFDVFNPSCLPLTITESSLDLTGLPLDLAASTRASLPKTLANGEVYSICVEYRPTAREDLDRTIELKASSGESIAIHVNGFGQSPELVIGESTLDFGFVLVGESMPQDVNIRNIGNLTAEVTISKEFSDPDFAVGATTLSIPPGSAVDLAVAFTPITDGLSQDRIIFQTNYTLDTLGVRGIGAFRGVELDVTKLDFGPTRLGTTNTMRIHVRSNAQPITLESVEVEQFPDVFTHNANALLPFSFTDAADGFDLDVTFAPDAEGQWNSTLLFTSPGNNPIRVELTGEGAEPHVSAPQELNFGTVAVESESIESVRVTNSGKWPLLIKSANATGAFAVLAPPQNVIVAPGASYEVSLIFRPVAEKPVTGELILHTDADPEVTIVNLKGAGGPVALDRPQIVYAIDAVNVMVGEQFSMPVKILGNRLESITSDSFYIQVRYEPELIAITGYDVFASIADGYDVTMAPLDDSTMVISGKGSSRALGSASRLISLRAVALLGPDSLTSIRIASAFPSTNSTLAAASATISILNCKEEPVAGTYRGEYSVQAPYPLPATDRSTIKYKLGLPGIVTIDVFDNLGRYQGQFYRAEKPRGEHVAELELTSLGNGQYTYVFRSLEFVQHGAMIVQH